MAASIIDIERRLELAAQELMKTCAVLIALVTAARVFRKNDTSHAVDYPCATVMVIGAPQFGDRTGWYLCALQLSAMTYRSDDQSKEILEQVAGALRGFLQQTDIHTQLNTTAIATATATALDVREVLLDGPSFDASTDKIQETVVTASALCRPTQAVTT